jgi:magnesium-protoporphyrin O-methyltransferase
MSCCSAAAVFDERRARRDLDGYRRRGPSPSTTRLIVALRGAGRPLDTLLDVGGGVGTIVHELLERGVTNATLVESSGAYLAAAEEESARRTTRERLQLREGDVVDLAADIPISDVVTLDKVVCCYPDMASLLSVSAACARELYGIVYPRDGWWVRLAIVVENQLRHLRGSSFRNYVHSNSAIHRELRRTGLTLRFRSRGAWWVVALYERDHQA